MILSLFPLLPNIVQTQNLPRILPKTEREIGLAFVLGDTTFQPPFFLQNTSFVSVGLSHCCQHKEPAVATPRPTPCIAGVWVFSFPSLGPLQVFSQLIWPDLPFLLMTSAAFPVQGGFVFFVFVSLACSATAWPPTDSIGYTQCACEYLEFFSLVTRLNILFSFSFCLFCRKHC